jgi:hypothetical protein
MYGFCRATDLGKMIFYFFMQKLKLKSICMFCRSCTSHTGHNKIGFANFGFFYDVISILQITGSKGINLKNLLLLWPLELLKLHTNTLGSCTQALGEKSLHIHTLLRRGKLAGGEVGPEKANKQGGSDWAHV